MKTGTFLPVAINLGDPVAFIVESDNRYQRLLPHYQRTGFCPAGGDVGQHQAVNVTSSHRFAAMRDHVHLEESWRRIVPVRKRPYCNASSQRRVDRRATSPLTACFAGGGEQTIDRRGA